MVNVAEFDAWVSGLTTRTVAVPAFAMSALARKYAPESTISLVDVNGMTGTMIVAPDGRVTVTSYTIDDGRIVAIDVQRNPEKLRRLP